MADIYNDTDGKIITGTASADTIHNSGANNVSISAGAGNDYVRHPPKLSRFRLAGYRRQVVFGKN